MGRTFEALERAEKEYKKRAKQAGVDPEERGYLAPDGAQTGKGQVKPDHLGSLKTRILTRYAAKAARIKTILVTGTAQGGGTSTTTSLAEDPHTSVLIVDANLRTPGLHRLFNTEAAEGMAELLTASGEKKFQFKKVADNDLYLFPCGVKRVSSDGYFESKSFDQFLGNVRNSFDYVIFDSPPVPGFPDTQTLCAKVDGVILVVTYDRTRRQVALRAKIELEGAGANILGVVINRRKYYIPEWVYRRL
jgi:capsular exopolysaccharide synthesis family protein